VLRASYETAFSPGIEPITEHAAGRRAGAGVPPAGDGPVPRHRAAPVVDIGRPAPGCGAGAFPGGFDGRLFMTHRIYFSFSSSCRLTRMAGLGNDEAVGESRKENAPNPRAGRGKETQAVGGFHHTPNAVAVASSNVQAVGVVERCSSRLMPSRWHPPIAPLFSVSSLAMRQDQGPREIVVEFDNCSV
jgi:hypothetical protein